MDGMGGGIIDDALDFLGTLSLYQSFKDSGGRILLATSYLVSNIFPVSVYWNESMLMLGFINNNKDDISLFGRTFHLTLKT